MDQCQVDMVGDRISLVVPGKAVYREVVLAFTEGMARLAGFGGPGAGRCRLVAEEVFQHIAHQCQLAGRADDCRLVMELTADGLSLCFTTDHLTYDPEQIPSYSLDALLEGREQDGLGLLLVKQYAQSITLTRRGRERELCLLIAKDSEPQGARPWSQLVPDLAPGVSLHPAERDGKLTYRLEDKARGKTYAAKALAHQVISLVDGHLSFGRIMAQTLKVMPELQRRQVEELFEALIQRGLVSLRSLPRPAAEITVREQLEPRTLQALQAYRKASDEGPPSAG